MESWRRKRPQLAAWMLLLWMLPLLLVSSASASDSGASSTPASATATDACTVLREAYRLRLVDLATARRDSAVAVARATARGDSLAVSLRWATWRLDAAREDAPAWWEDARLSFLAGALAMALVVAATGR